MDSAVLRLPNSPFDHHTLSAAIASLPHSELLSTPSSTPAQHGRRARHVGHPPQRSENPQQLQPAPRGELPGQPAAERSSVYPDGKRSRGSTRTPPRFSAPGLGSQSSLSSILQVDVNAPGGAAGVQSIPVWLESNDGAPSIMSPPHYRGDATRWSTSVGKRPSWLEERREVAPPGAQSGGLRPRGKDRPAVDHATELTGYQASGDNNLKKVSMSSRHPYGLQRNEGVDGDAMTRAQQEGLDLRTATPPRFSSNIGASLGLRLDQQSASAAGSPAVGRRAPILLGSDGPVARSLTSPKPRAIGASAEPSQRHVWTQNRPIWLDQDDGSVPTLPPAPSRQRDKDELRNRPEAESVGQSAEEGTHGDDHLRRQAAANLRDEKPINAAVALPTDDEVVQVEFEPCPHCSRAFAKARLGRHVEVCQRSRAPPSLTARSGIRRYDGMSNLSSNSTDTVATDSTTASGDTWVRAPEPRRAGRREPKAQPALLGDVDGEPNGSVRGDSGLSSLSGSLRESSTIVGRRDPDRRVECPHCHRRFNEDAAARHIPHCGELHARVPRMPKPEHLAAEAAATAAAEKEAVEAAAAALKRARASAAPRLEPVSTTLQSSDGMESSGGSTI